MSGLEPSTKPSPSVPEHGITIGSGNALTVALHLEGDVHPPSNSNSGSIFPPTTPDWNKLKVIHRNTLPPRSSFFLYYTEEDALIQDVELSKSQLLSGWWKFQWSKSPFDGPVGFQAQHYEDLDWRTVKVPGMWQCQGFGKGPQYTNVNFPFPVVPPHVPVEDNECGRYVYRFGADPEIDHLHQYRLRFEGVDSSFSCWLNGHYVGYSQGSRNPSEFDVTKHINIDGFNTLCVEVYQRCNGSYIEDQVCEPQQPSPNACSLAIPFLPITRTNGGSVASFGMFTCTDFLGPILKTSTFSLC